MVYLRRRHNMAAGTTPTKNVANTIILFGSFGKGDDRLATMAANVLGNTESNGNTSPSPEYSRRLRTGIIIYGRSHFCFHLAWVVVRY